MTTTRSRRGHTRSRGQALVEFSLILIPFLFILMGIVDLGRGIYTNNAVSEAAQELGRVTSVHPCAGGSCTTLGDSAETLGVLSTQKRLVPGLGDPTATTTFTCVDITDANAISATHPTCKSGDFVKVSVAVKFSVATPLLGFGNPFTFSSVSHVQLP